ncbi:HCL628Wp [Eremothecium sinecaudum]|uniref:HCL628Wp n=1 Tax=Eremothecium sinecaudum TaxID=45286 RepID=A0A109UY00_9SACH|nr:HCL628Wp [Eremothecium sinecaudum]AMD19523.1 HCL628Wp [Eremothecium sinecaudum]
MVEHSIQRVVNGDLITLVKRDEDGYFQLDSFIEPLITHEYGVGNRPEHFDHYQEDALLGKYGILVDTDENSVKWITNSKAKQLIDVLGWGAEFSEIELNASKNGANGVKGDLDGSLTDRSDRGNAGSATEGGAAKERSAADSNVHLTQGEDNERVAKRRIQEGQQGPMEDGRVGGGDSLSADASPMKKMKPVADLRLFSHDLGDFCDEELQLVKAPAPFQDFTPDERLKLEALLQRILFPDGSGQPQFEEALEEVERTYADVELKWDIPIDEHGNTALHWLCSIASVSIVQRLVERGTNRRLGDKMGETALVKSVKSVNNYDSGTFEELLDYLYPCMVEIDESYRTVLHHIVLTSGMQGCSAAAKYYLDILMGWIVKKHSRNFTVESEGTKVDTIIKNLDLKWFIANVLNARDLNGDTCLNIASRLGNISIVEALLDYGADPYIANNSGLRPVDFGAGVSMLSFNNEMPTKGTHNYTEDGNSIEQLTKRKVFPPPDSSTLLTRMKTLVSSISNEYEIELHEHEEKLRGLQIQLNNKREELAASRDRLAKARQLKDENEVLAERLVNIETSIKEEEAKFAQRTQELGIDPADYKDMEEFDADEPFRIDFIYAELETKLNEDFHGDLDSMNRSTDLDKFVEELLRRHGSRDQNANDLLPSAAVLQSRIGAYRRNEKQLEEHLSTIEEKHKKLENKFRKVLSLCLKVEEDKVDGMLDGLLQAITYEDPEEIDIDEMQDFLKKHG